MRTLANLAVRLWIVCIALRLCLPAWDLCWDRDGRICGALATPSCCAGERSSTDPADDECEGCTDLHIQPAVGHEKPITDGAQGGHLLAWVAACTRHAAIHEPLQRVGPRARSVSPPDPGAVLHSRPLRC